MCLLIRSQWSVPRGHQCGRVALMASIIWSANLFASASTAAERPGNPRAAPEEIIVTAQKMEERLQDVPVSVTAVSSGSLVETNQLRVQDYYAKVPGLNMVLGGDHGGPQVAIRGITTGGATSPTVATMIDDIPFGPSTIEGYGNIAPDIDPSDLQRVEVLRGPQGTLYGANSLGGLIKYVTVDPSPDRMSGSVRLGSATVKNGNGFGHNAHGAINMPLGEASAVRLSAFTRRDPGYIDNVTTGEEGVNELDTLGGRVAALWRPSDVFSLKLSALYQKAESDGSSEVHVLPGLGDLEQAALPRTGWYEKELEAVSAIMKVGIGGAELTSLTGISSQSLLTNIDGTPVASIVSQIAFGVPGLVSRLGPVETEKVTQEFRLAVPLGNRVDWLFGVFYTDEEVASPQDIYAAEADTGRKVGSLLLTTPGLSTFEEYAVFTDVTFKITERFDVQVGGRASENKQTNGPTTFTGPWNIIVEGRTSDVVVQPRFESKDDPVTYLLTPRFRFSDDLMGYARFASGYRPGGPNTFTLNDPTLPREFGADTTEDYELGLKGTVLDGRMTFDASVFYIDWNDIQLQLRTPNFATYFANGGKARSQGAELTVEARPAAGLTVSTAFTYTDAELTEDFPETSTAVGLNGDRLPYSADFVGSVSIEQEFSLTDNVMATLGGTLLHVGEREGVFHATPGRQIFPSYSQVDLRGSVSWGTWTMDAFVNNITDRRGMLRGGRDAPFASYPSFNYTQPRTAGLSLTKSFE
jgi:iron complex outermembrane recepter protein